MLAFFNIAAGSCKECESPFAITHSQLRTLSPRTIGQQRVAGAIPDLRPSLDSDVRTALIGSPSRTTLITGVGSSLSILVTLVSMYSYSYRSKYSSLKMKDYQGFFNTIWVSGPLCSKASLLWTLRIEPILSGPPLGSLLTGVGPSLSILVTLVSMYS